MKKIQQINLQYNLATCKNTLHPAENNPLKPTADQELYSIHYITQKTLLNPSASYNLYRTHCTNRITTPSNSHQNRIKYNERIQITTMAQALLYKNKLQ